jgi:hypothetical protein
MLFTNGKDVLIQDAEGNVRNSAHINLGDDVLIKQVVVSEGNTFMLYQIIASGKVQIGVLKLNNTLQLDWYKTMSVNSGSLTSYSIVADAQYIYIANNNCTNGLTITKINQNGEMVWNKTYHVGIGTIVPGSMMLFNSQIIVFSKHTSGSNYALISSAFNMNGAHIKSESYMVSNSFYIRKAERLNDKYLVLINYNTGVVSSELIEIAASSYKGYLIQASSALQLNDFVTSENNLFFCGNVYVNTDEHLNAVLFGCNANMQSIWAKEFGSLTNNNLGYDDAHCISKLDQTLCVNGINADKGFTLSFTNDQKLFCSVNNIQNVSVQTKNYNKNNFNLTEGSTPIYNLQLVSSSSQTIQFDNSSFCVYDMVAVNTSTENISTSTDNSAIKIFPNPAKDIVNLEFNTLMPTCYWELSDMNGRIIKGGMGDMKKLSFGVEELSSGLYLIRWKSGTQLGVERLVISR